MKSNIIWDLHEQRYHLGQLYSILSQDKQFTVDMKLNGIKTDRAISGCIYDIPRYSFIVRPGVQFSSAQFYNHSMYTNLLRRVRLLEKVEQFRMYELHWLRHSNHCIERPGRHQSGNPGSNKTGKNNLLVHIFLIVSHSLNWASSSIFQPLSDPEKWYILKE